MSGFVGCRVRNGAYDANGRMITRGSDDISWYSCDRPKKIESGTKSTEFWYSPDRARYRQEQATSGTPDAVIRYAGTLLEFDAWGLKRNASDWSALGSPFVGSHETERGYTGTSISTRWGSFI